MGWIEILREIEKKDGELTFAPEKKEVPSYAALKINRGNVVRIEKQKSGFKITINVMYIKNVDEKEAEREKLYIAEKYGFKNRPQDGKWWKKVKDIDESEVLELAGEMKNFVKLKSKRGQSNMKIGRGLEEDLVKKFKNSEWLKFYKKHEKDGLFLGIRNNYFNIYYQCASLSKIDLRTEIGEIAKRYLNPKDEKGYIKITPKFLEKNYTSIKDNIEKIQTKKIEKVAQQKLIINNNLNPESDWFCVDLEYVLQLDGKKSEYGRFDIIAITKKEPYHLALIELKATSGAIGGISKKFREFLERNESENEIGIKLLQHTGSLREVGSLGSGVLGHAYDYVNYLNSGFYEKYLKKEIINIIKNYQELDIINNNILVDISEDKISERPEIYFLTINNEKDSLRKTMYNYLCDKNKNASKYNLEKIFGINLTEDNSYFNPVFLFSEDNGDNINDIIGYAEYQIGFKVL